MSQTARHPGRILETEFISRLPHGTTQAEISDRLRISRRRLNELIREKRSVTPDTALRLARLFGTTAEFWLDAQAAWDLQQTTESRRQMREIEAIKPWFSIVPEASPGEGSGQVLLSAGVESKPQRETFAEAYYEQFLEKKGLLKEAKRFVRIQAQIDVLGLTPDKQRPARSVTLSPPAFFPTFSRKPRLALSGPT